MKFEFSERGLGMSLVIVSAVVFSAHGLFVKGVEAGAWEVIFWRGVFSVGFSLIYILMRGRFRREMLQMGRSGLAVAVVGAMGTGVYIPALKLTTIANVTLIYAAAPIFASILAWVFVGERLPRRTILAVVMAFAGVTVIVSGTLGGLHLRGDLLALCMTLAMAVMLVIYRAFPATPAAGPMVLSSVLLMVPAIILGKPFAVTPLEIAILAVFGLTFAVASVTLAEGARRIPATQTALLSILETPLAPVLAFVVLAEVPALTTVVGGAIVFVAVLWAQAAKREP